MSLRPAKDTGHRPRRLQETVQMAFSPPSRLADLRAAMDSYAVELLRDGLPILRAPLHWCAYEPDKEYDPWNSPFPPVIDKTIEISLVRYSPAPDDFLQGIRERNTRWPFFVGEPMEIWLSFRDQWRLYKFSPGKFYEERRMDYGTANVKPGAQSDTPEAK